MSRLHEVVEEEVKDTVENENMMLKKGIHPLDKYLRHLSTNLDQVLALQTVSLHPSYNSAFPLEDRLEVCYIVQRDYNKATGDIKLELLRLICILWLCMESNVRILMQLFPNEMTSFVHILLGQCCHATKSVSDYQLHLSSLALGTISCVLPKNEKQEVRGFLDANLQSLPISITAHVESCMKGTATTSLLLILVFIALCLCLAILVLPLSSYTIELCNISKAVSIVCFVGCVGWGYYYTSIAPSLQVATNREELIKYISTLPLPNDSAGLLSSEEPELELELRDTVTPSLAEGVNSLLDNYLTLSKNQLTGESISDKGINTTDQKFESALVEALQSVSTNKQLSTFSNEAADDRILVPDSLLTQMEKLCKILHSDSSVDPKVLNAVTEDTKLLQSLKLRD